MKMLSRTLICLAMLTGTSQASVVKLEGVEFKEEFRSEGVNLPLRGASLLRYKVLFRGYVAALYAEPGREVLEDVPRRLEIEYFWPIPAEALSKATLDGIRRNVSPERLDALRDSIERFSRLYADIQPGDRYALTHAPGSGTTLTLNGETRGQVEGADFAAALFSIWLGEAPFDHKLKTALLGEKS